MTSTISLLHYLKFPYEDPFAPPGTRGGPHTITSTWLGVEPDKNNLRSYFEQPMGLLLPDGSLSAPHLALHFDFSGDHIPHSTFPKIHS